MPEKIVLPQPIRKSRTSWSVGRISIDFVQESVRVVLVADDMISQEIDYPTPAPIGRDQASGRKLIADLNSASPQAGSLHKRILSQILADGYEEGTIQGE